MKVLITGICGFIGNHLNRILRQTYPDVEIWGFDNLSSGNNFDGIDKTRFIQGDICERDLFLMFTVKFDYIFHLACIASPVQYQQKHVTTLRTCSTGVFNVVEYALWWCPKAVIVFTSTSEVYGDPEIHPQPETYNGNVNTLGPRSCYDEGKRFAESLMNAFRLENNLDIRIARLFNSYGPNMKPSDGRVISTFIDQINNNVPLTIYGDGSQTRSFCHVEDTVDGLITLAMAHKQVGIGPFNIGNNEEVTISQLASYIAPDYPIEYRPARVEDPIRRCPDLTKTRNVLKWSPKIKLEDGLKRLTR
jgi:UDP-glucuronate decarboxylase